MTPDQYRCEGFQAGIEAAARITEGGYRCRSCGQVFLNDNGHSDAECSQGYPNWDTATDAQKATAIRAIDPAEVLAGLPSVTPKPTLMMVQPTFDLILDLVGELGREVYHLLDDCETSGPIGEEIHTITDEGLTKVSAILDRIDALPFEEPGVMLGTGAMLQAAIMQTFAHPPQPSETVAEAQEAVSIDLIDAQAVADAACKEVRDE